MEATGEFSSLDMVVTTSFVDNGGEGSRNVRKITDRAFNKNSNSTKLPSIEATVVSESSKEDEGNELTENITNCSSEGKAASAYDKDAEACRNKTPPRHSSKIQRSYRNESTTNAVPTNKQIKSKRSFKPRTPRLDEFLASQNPCGEHTMDKPIHNRSHSGSITQKVENIRCPKTGRLKPKPKPYVTRVHREFVKNYVLQRQVDEEEDREFWESLDFNPPLRTSSTRSSETNSNPDFEGMVQTKNFRNPPSLTQIPMSLSSRKNPKRFESIRDLIPRQEPSKNLTEASGHG